MLSLRKCCLDALTTWVFFCWAGSPSNWSFFPPECCWLERRGIYLPASTVLEIVASLASIKPKDPVPRPKVTDSFLYLQSNNLQILSLLTTNRLSSASSSSSSSMLSSDLSPLLGLQGRSCAPNFGEYWSSIFCSRASTIFLFAHYVANILLLGATIT